MPKIVMKSAQIPRRPFVRVSGEKVGRCVMVIFYTNIFASLIATRFRSNRVVLKKRQGVPIIVFQAQKRLSCVWVSSAYRTPLNNNP
jgi:hypothetical protein